MTIPNTQKYRDKKAEFSDKFNKRVIERTAAICPTDNVAIDPG